MALALKNATCQQMLDDCEAELVEIERILSQLSSFDKQVPFLTRYSIIISAATMEKVCKGLIVDFCEVGSNVQMKHFLDKNFREQALNVKYDAICKTLCRFDDEWNRKFKSDLNNLKSASKWRTSLDSLIDLRNSFAHGGRPTTTFKTVHEYFRHSRRVMIILERSILS